MEPPVAAFIKSAVAKVVADTGDAAELLFAQPDLKRALFGAAYKGLEDEFRFIVNELTEGGITSRQIFSSVGTGGHTLWKAVCMGPSTDLSLFVLEQLDKDCTFKEAAVTLCHAYGSGSIFNTLHKMFTKNKEEEEEEEEDSPSPFSVFKCKLDLFTFQGVSVVLKGVPDSFLAGIAASACLAGKTPEAVSIRGLWLLFQHDVDLNTGMFNSFFPLFFAAEAEKLQVLQFMLDNGFNLRVTTSEPSYSAVFGPGTFLATHVPAQYLQMAGPYLGSMFIQSNGIGRTVLHVCRLKPKALAFLLGRVKALIVIPASHYSAVMCTLCGLGCRSVPATSMNDEPHANKRPAVFQQTAAAFLPDLVRFNILSFIYEHPLVDQTDSMGNTPLLNAAAAKILLRPAPAPAPTNIMGMAAFMGGGGGAPAQPAGPVSYQEKQKAAAAAAAHTASAIKRQTDQILCVQQLLNAGAKPLFPNKQGINALDYAKSFNRDRIMLGTPAGTFVPSARPPPAPGTRQETAADVDLDREQLIRAFATEMATAEAEDSEGGGGGGGGGGSGGGSKTSAAFSDIMARKKTAGTFVPNPSVLPGRCMSVYSLLMARVRNAVVKVADYPSNIMTSVHDAARFNDVPAAKCLVQLGASVNRRKDAGLRLSCASPDRSETPLLRAVLNKHLGMIKLLLDLGANPHSQSVRETEEREGERGQSTAEAAGGLHADEVAGISQLAASMAAPALNVTIPGIGLTQQNITPLTTAVTQSLGRAMGMVGAGTAAAAAPEAGTAVPEAGTAVPEGSEPSAAEIASSVAVTGSAAAAYAAAAQRGAAMATARAVHAAEAEAAAEPEAEQETGYARRIPVSLPAMSNVSAADLSDDEDDGEPPPLLSPASTGSTGSTGSVQPSRSASPDPGQHWPAAPADQGQAMANGFAALFQNMAGGGAPAPPRQPLQLITPFEAAQSDPSVLAIFLEAGVAAPGPVEANGQMGGMMGGLMGAITNAMMGGRGGGGDLGVVFHQAL